MRITMLLLAASTALAASATHAAEPFLFQERHAQADRSAPVPAFVVRGRPVHVDITVLGDTAGGPLASAPVVGLNLFDDVVLLARPLRSERTPRGFNWVGSIDGEPLGNAIFSVVDGIVSGSVVSPRGAYSIRSTPAGSVIEEVDQGAFPEHPDYLLPERPHDLDVATAPGRALDSALEPSAQLDDGALIDVLVVYTPAAKAAAGGDAAIQSRIQLGITETNQGYVNSGVIQRLRLAAVQEISYAEFGTDASGMQTDLTRLTGTSDGNMDAVHALRDSVKADLVSLIVTGYNNPGGGCGVAWLMAGNDAGFAANAFSVVDLSCISPNYSFGHELGHNMGLNHARADATGPGAYGYSFGYKDPAYSFRTVMAYNCTVNCPRVLYFSNPTVSYAGKPTGIPDTAADSASNALSLNNTRLTVANWRVADTPPAGLVNRYRLYNDFTKEHHFTTDANEYAVLGTRGWLQEGVAHKIYTGTAPVSGVTPTALYRLYNPGVLQHLWTTDANEYAVLGTRGWLQEGLDGYILPAQAAGTVPLYRLAYTALPLHLWTTDGNEYSVLNTRGWVQEGPIGYVIP